MANFWKFNGSEERNYPAYQLTADPGYVYDFGSGTVPGDGRWVSDPGPATAPPPPVLPGVVAAGPQQGQVLAWDATLANYKPTDLGGTFARQGQGIRPLRAACIGTSIYANDLRTADSVVVDVSSSPAWDYTKMSRYMQGHGGRSWFTWMCLMSGGRIMAHYNGAESGSTLTQQQARFSRDIIPQKPDLIFLGDATNDINTGVDDPTIRSLITQQVGQALAANITPVLVASIHRSDDATKNGRVRTHNEWLRRYSWANGYHFIDPFSAIVDPASTTAYTLASMTVDGLHPNVLGAKTCGQRALDEMAGLLRGNANPAQAKFIPQHRAATPNLLVNPLFQDDANADGKADSWSISGTTYSAGRSVTDGATTSASTTVTSATAAFVAGDVGRTITGTGIPAGATISSVTNGTTVVISAAATATATGVSLTFGSLGNYSLVTDSRVIGKLQQLQVTANGQTLNQGITVDGTNVSVGDRLAFSGLIEVTAAAGSLQWNVGIYTLGQTGTWASNAIGYGGSNGGGPTGGADLSLAAFYCELTVPTGATVARCEAKAFTGTGTIKVAQWKCVNLTKLGLDTLY